jgi:hypothetical protein
MAEAPPALLWGRHRQIRMPGFIDAPCCRVREQSTTRRDRRSSPRRSCESLRERRKRSPCPQPKR